MVVVGGFPKGFRQGLPLRHPQQEHLGLPAQAQDRLWQVELLALRCAVFECKHGGEGRIAAYLETSGNRPYLSP